MFQYRGCPDADELVYETLDRAGRRLLEMGDRFEGSNPGRYVFGVAWNVARESFRRRTPEPLPEGQDLPDRAPDHGKENEELRSACLDRCLARLPEDDRRVTLKYHQGERQARIRSRATLARDLGVSPNALRLKVHRITRRLRQCVFQCMDEGGMSGFVPAGPHLVKG